MAGLSTSAARASGVSGPLRQYLPRQDGREEQQRGSGVIGLVRLEDPPYVMRARGPVDSRDPSPSPYNALAPGRRNASVHFT